MITYEFQHLLSTEGWLSPGYITINATGHIVEISGERSNHLIGFSGGIAIPGFVNLHSHAFQRGFAGLSEYGSPHSVDSFLVWRDLMYRFALHLNPDDQQAIAARLYVEMLKSGYTSVAEFHYLHHDPAGMQYAHPAEMSLGIIDVAEEVGINLTLLPVFYQHSNFGRNQPEQYQRRFVTDVDSFGSIFERLKSGLNKVAGANLGIALHSLRAVNPESAREVLQLLGPDQPIHIHIAEQKKEVDDCLLWSGQRPVEFLLNNFHVDERWCLVHATHMNEQELVNAAATDVVVGLCPMTEAKLGDGLFDLANWLGKGGKFGIGSDSNVSQNPVEEIRWLEYGQRLNHQKRNFAASEQCSTGARLFQNALAGGVKALGRDIAGFQKNALADIVVLDPDAAIFAGQSTDTYLDSWLLSGNSPVITDVFVSGRHVICEGRHAYEEDILDRYRHTMEMLIAAI